MIALAVGATLFGRAPLLAEEPPERYLDVWSEGSSRFEIEGEDVVAVFSEGVEFAYLGCHAQAKALSYNQATQVATATGDVVLFTADADLSAQEMEFNGRDGLLALRGGVSGQLGVSGYLFNTDEAEVRFSPEDPSFKLEDLEVKLIGKITLASSSGDMFATQDLTYYGATGEFSSMTPFLLTAAASRWSEDGESPVDLTGLKLYGTDISGKYDAEQGLTQLALKNLSLSAEGIELTLDSATLNETERTKKVESDKFTASLLSARWVLDNPVGWIKPRTGDRIDLAAGSGWAEVDENGMASIELSDGVTIQYPGMPLEAETVKLVQVPGGFALQMPGDVAVSFDLASMTGTEPIDGQVLQTQLAQ